MQIRNRIKELRQVKASELLPNPRNWRRHPAGQADALRGALAEIGYADALIAYETPDGLMLIDGHLRAETTPDMEVPVLVTDLDEGEANKLLMTLDPLAAMASADTATFDALRQMTTVDSDALQEMLDAITGGNLKSLEAMQKPKAGLTDPDEVPPEPEEAWVQVGDLFQLGEHRILCGDSTKAGDVDVLMDGALAQMVFTDPPYGMGKDFANDASSDMRAFHYSWLQSWTEQASSMLVWSKPAGMADIILPADALGWKQTDYLHLYKPNDVTFPRFSWIRKSESMLIFGNCEHVEVKPFAHDTYLWNHTGKDETLVHPTVKPMEVVRDVISRFAARSIADPFLGSGTTLIACEKLDRICYGMEIEPRYVQVAIERWQNYTGQKAVKL